MSLPTEGEYLAVDARLQKGYDALEALEQRLRRDESTVPTLADVGALWSFLAGLDLQLQQMQRERDELRDRLAVLDEARLTATVHATPLRGHDG